MKTWLKVGAMAAVVVAVSLMVVSALAFAQVPLAGGPGGGQGAAGAGSGQLAVAPVSATLTAAEVEALTYMREEEKLARDVYTTLSAQWGLATFQNISQSEQTHMDAIKTLLDRYGVADPAQAQAGRFTDPALQKLYTELVARGQVSLSEALKVGAAIEEIDLRDLQAREAQSTNADVLRVFGNLERGSDNHLRAFVNALAAQTGETYAPQTLSLDAYRAIVTGSNASGNGRSTGLGSTATQNRGPRWSTAP
jgi:hypothetical protein